MEIAPVGELSKKSISFSKDINYLSVAEGLTANVFYTKAFDASNAVSARTLDSDDKTNIKNVLKTYYDLIEASTAQLSIPSLVTTLSDTYPTISDISFESPVKSDTDKDYYGYFSFAFTVAGIKRYYNVWCSDSIFQSTYPITEYVVVPMFANLSRFWANPVAVIDDIESANPYDHMVRVQNAVGDFPPTGIFYDDYAYVDPGNASVTTNVKWAIIYYGNSISPDTIKQALVSYLTSNDTHTAAQWKTIFPDIFSNTKFVFYPLWSEYSIPNMQAGQTGIFKNNFNMKKLMQKAVSYFTDYTADEINNNLHYMPMPYKSIGVLSMPGKDNPDTRLSIDAMFTDIINITSVSPDYNRMSVNTQDFLTLLNQCLVAGENFTNTTILPSKVYRVVRFNKTFIAFTYKSAEYIVAPKSAL